MFLDCGEAFVGGFLRFLLLLRFLAASSVLLLLLVLGAEKVLAGSCERVGLGSTNGARYLMLGEVTALI